MEFPATVLFAAKKERHSRKRFTQEEDNLLRQLVDKYGTEKWDIISREMKGRTGRQCRDRYRNYLIPGFFNGQWSEEEDRLLIQKYKEIGPQWTKMIPFFRGRSANSIKNRWNYFVCRIYNSEQREISAPSSPKEDITTSGMTIDVQTEEHPADPVQDFFGIDDWLETFGSDPFAMSF